MFKKKVTSLLLSLVMIGSCLPLGSALADTDKNKRLAYIHAGGANPTETTDTSTVYMGENADVYFAVDNPNKGDFENDIHKEPQYDMNGYTITMYFDPMYFDFSDDTDLSSPIDYTVPDTNTKTTETGSETTGSGSIDVPITVGYYPTSKGTASATINGKSYKSAYLTVFFSGDYVPQKSDSALWYNLCKLKLKPLRTGSTQVFFDTSGTEEKTLELFAKNTSEELSDQTFSYTAINGGWHSITIKDKSRPAAPTANPPEGNYTEKQNVTLTAEDGCDIYYSTDNVNFYKYTAPVEIEITSKIYCYAQRISDGKQSSTVSFEYRILPKAPYLFVDKNGTKSLIKNIYNENSSYKVYVSDKEIFGPIEAENTVYYTFSDISEENITEGSDPETSWVKLSNATPTIDITKKVRVRLITEKMGEYSEVSEYYLGVRPAKVTATPSSGEFSNKTDVELSCATKNAEIFYTVDGSDPVTNGLRYDGVLTLSKDTTLRTVAKYDDIFGEVSSFHYVFTARDDFGVDAFYPSGRYEGSVNVTLTANNPENTVEYRLDGESEWHTYTKAFVFDKDTLLYARAGKNGVYGDEYKFTYKIYPLPPVFAPESTQFTNATEVTLYCIESTKDTKDRFELYYTLDGSDPTLSTSNRIKAEGELDSAVVNITKYTVIKAAVLKDGEAYSSVVTHSYDIVTKKPSRPLTTLTPGNYIRKIGDKVGFSTQFMPVVSGTEIYYNVSYDGAFIQDPTPVDSTKYDRVTPIEIKGRTLIKAISVNVFGVKSDVGFFEYTVTPEAPKAAPSATIGENRLPVVPVSAVLGSTVKYEINGFANEFVASSENFYIDTATGNAYEDAACTKLLGKENKTTLSSPAVLNISAELDGVESESNRYVYTLSTASSVAPPYADKETGEYEEIKADDDNNLLHIRLYSLNSGDTIQYKLNNASSWNNYTDGEVLKIKEDTVLQIRSIKNGIISVAQSYVYNFVPLAPIITLASGRYPAADNCTTEITYDSRAPQDKIDDDTYSLWYRENGDKQDFRYNDSARKIDHTMSFKAYVKNEKTNRISKNTIHYYIIEKASSASGNVYIASPYDVSRISADVLSSGEYAKGIKLLSQNKNASIHYYYTYTQTDFDGSITTQNLVYDNTPITVNPSMTSIKITAWLIDADGSRIENSDFEHKIDFIHLEVPKTSLGSDKVEFKRGTKYTILNDYPDDETILIYYTLDGSSPESSETAKIYSGEELTLNSAVTVKAVYLSACGTCIRCKDNDFANCIDKVFGKVGTYNYTVTKSGGTGSTGSGSLINRGDNTGKYTKDIFGNEHSTHIGYINGYPDGSVKPDGEITREEIASVLYRITNHEYEKPFIATGEVFHDVSLDRWSAHDIEYMTDKDVILGYPDNEFKPENNLTRAEFAALICRFAKLTPSETENPFSDLENTHWAYDNIITLTASGLMQGYEDETYRPENQITRAEVMTVINKILGRKPSEAYVKTLNFNPYTDLQKDKWYYTAVLEATITHNYSLDDSGFEIKWEDCK